jgi:nucleoside-diphosphate-sugar epimerase
MADMLIRMIRPGAKVVCDEERLRPAKSEVERLLGANEKIRRLTGWEPKYSFEDGLRLTVDWFSNPSNLAAYKADIYNY